MSIKWTRNGTYCIQWYFFNIECMYMWSCCSFSLLLMLSFVQRINRVSFPKNINYRFFHSNPLNLSFNCRETSVLTRNRLIKCIAKWELFCFCCYYWNWDDFMQQRRLWSELIKKKVECTEFFVIVKINKKYE